MKVALGGISHETNTFSTVKTTRMDFNPIIGDEVTSILRGTRSGPGGFMDVLDKHGVQYVPTLVAGATPAGPLAQTDYVELVESMVKMIGDSGVDGVLLALHGAMVAEKEPEAEAFLLESIRRKVGSLPLIITLDLHGMVSHRIVEGCDAVFGYDTNPHIDMYERGVEAAEAMVKTLNGGLHPVTAVKKLPMMPPTINQRTTEGPMVKLLQEARRLEEQDGVINVCIFPAFPYADVARAGSSVVAVTDGDKALAQELADGLGEKMWSIRGEFLKPLTPIDTAVRVAMTATEWPVILADVADNPGGGAPGDSTVILRELLTRGANGVGVACIKDPEAVSRAVEAGVNGVLDMSIGAKTDGFHGEPLHIRGRVRTITDGRFTAKAMAVGVPVDVGRTAVIEVDGVKVILTEKSHAPNDPEIYRRNGIEPTDMKILLLKSRGHFRAAYEPFSSMVLEVDAPGLTSPNLDWFTYHNIRRPMWPFDEA